MSQAAAVFEMANGARFWWMPTADQIRSDRFSESFAYDDLRSVTLFDFVDFGAKQWRCDLDSVAKDFLNIPKLQVQAAQDVAFLPAHPKNRVLVLKLQQALL